jgi:hypothetical protein
MSDTKEDRTIRSTKEKLKRKPPKRLVNKTIPRVKPPCRGCGN